MATQLAFHHAQSSRSETVDGQTARRKVVRESTACLECQRRKQKCSRQWPCNNCAQRKMPQICRFASTKAEENGDAPFAKSALCPIHPCKDGQALTDIRASRKRKEEPSELDPAFASAQNYTTPELQAEAVLKGLGYMPGHFHFRLAEKEKASDAPEAEEKEEERQRSKAIAFKAALEELGPLLDNRGPIDALIQNFFQGSNYHYYMIYPPQFTEQYTRWWDMKESGGALPPSFTSLLLRVCACSLQFLSETVRPKIESQLGDPQALTERFHDIATKVNGTMDPGKGGFFQVQQLLMTSWWFKSETRFVESWHALAGAILSAQEIGMDRDSRSQRLSEFDIEMRRRVWCLLYLWDWQMSALLGRPIILNHSHCRVIIPKLNLENPRAEPGLPSPYEHIALSADLVRTVSGKIGVIDKESTMAEASEFEAVIREWMERKLTGVYAVTDAVTKWDETHRYIVWQRKQLHLVAYLTGLIPLKAYLVQKPEDTPDPEEAARLREVAVDWCLKLMACSRDLFELVYPEYAKYHFGLFCVFDCAAAMCAAILHDEKRNLPRRDLIIDAVLSGVEMMRHLQSVTRVGEMSYRILAKLVATLPLTPQEKSARNIGAPKRVKKQGSVSNSDTTAPSESSETSGETLTSESTAPSMLGELTMPDLGAFDWTLPEIAFAPPLDLNDVSSESMGNFSMLFDWQGLGLDLTTPHMDTAYFPPPPPSAAPPLQSENDFSQVHPANYPPERL